MSSVSNNNYMTSPYDFTDSDYNSLITRWPFGQHRYKKKVAIIGAGMSGLTAALCLIKSGHSVTVYEANNTVGGRVKTLRDGFTRRLYAEAGAMRIPEAHKLTTSMIDTMLGTDARITFNHSRNDDHTFIHFNNTHTTRHAHSLAKDGRSLKFEIGSAEIGKTAEDLFEICIVNFINAMPELQPLWGKTFDDVSVILGDTSSDISKTYYGIMDTMSLRQFLFEKCYLRLKSNRRFDNESKLTTAAADYMCALLVLEMHLGSSMAAIVNGYNELFKTNKYFQIKGGMDSLPFSYVGLNTSRTDSIRKGDVDKLHQAVYYNARVRELNKRDVSDNDKDKREGIFVNWENSITKRYVEKQLEHLFDLVILATPFSALRHIKTNELMSARKRRAVRQLHYDNSCKVILEFNREFWNDVDITGGSSITDLPVRQIHYPVAEQGSILLASYTWGEDSLRWTSLNQEDRIRFALDDVEKVHDIQELERHCVGGTSHSWADHEFTSGAFAMFEPYQLVTLFGDVWKPEGRLHYCGEHTSVKHGWIEGAMESGLRVAHEVCRRIDLDHNLTNPDVAAPMGR